MFLQIASRFTRAFDSLLDAYAKLKDALPNISAVQQLFGPHEHVKVVLADVYKDILTFHDRATKFFIRKGSYAMHLTSVEYFQVGLTALSHFQVGKLPSR